MAFKGAGLFAAALLAAAPLAADDAADVRPGLGRARGTAGLPAVEAGPPAAGKPVWISVGRDDSMHPAFVGLSLGAPVKDGGAARVYEATEDRLPSIARMVHERWNRCGGFFAYSSRAEAEQDLGAGPGGAGGPYSVDQAAWAKPLVAKVEEASIRSTIETLSAFHNRYFDADTGVAAAEWVRQRWQSLAGGAPGASARLVRHAGWRQPSVVLTIPGETDEVVVLGGHLDSINGWGRAEARAPGADDNASGIAVLTETVRVLGASGFRPRRTIEVMGYAAEEVGLRGSQEIAREYARTGRKVAAVVQFDMTNFKGSASDLYLLEDNVDPALTAFLGRLIDAYVGGSWGTIRCGYACSDHASWSQNGFPASAAFESEMGGMNPKIHSSEDTLASAGGDAKHSLPFARLAVAFAVETAKAAGGGSAGR